MSLLLFFSHALTYQIVEFYAPWCGHCQNLKPAYEKAAKNLAGLAKVAAIDCDEDANKQFCGAHGVQGFPTLKIVRPGKKPGSKPIIEDYKGPRTASGITEEVARQINNHVTKLTDSDFEKFLEGKEAKAVLFTEKGTTSALIRGIAIDFLDVIRVGQIRSKETAAVGKFGIESFPALVLVKGGETLVYKGEMVKADMVEFLKQAGEPNPDPATKKAEKKGKADKKKAAKAKEETKAKDETKEAKTPEPEDVPEGSTADATDKSSLTLIPIPAITSYDQLVENCLQRKAHTCLLVNIPSTPTEKSEKALKAVSELNTKYIHGKRHLFPFFSLAADVEGAAKVRAALELEGEVELVAVNARRGWVRRYVGDFGGESVEAWIDGIRMGEGEKRVFPGELIAERKVGKKAEKVDVEAEMTAESQKSQDKATQATDAEPEVETEKPKEEIGHDEL